MVYFDFYGKFKKMYDIVACNYYVEDRTLILYTSEGDKWIFTGANSVKVSEDIIFNVYQRRRD